MGPTEPRNGRTIVQALFEELWKELDAIVDHLMSEGAPEIWTDEDGEIRAGKDFEGDGLKAHLQYGEWRGQAQGLAYALAVLTNPYQPDVDKIRAEEMERWEAGEEE